MIPRPADTLSPAELTQLFNDAYSDYFVPVTLGEEAFTAMVAMQDIDLASSRIVDHEGVPSAFALLAVRGTRGWIGGMGTRPGARRLGLGKQAMIAALEAAWARGLVRVELEVLVENAQAIALYERLGFVDQRRLEVWERPATADPPVPSNGLAELMVAATPQPLARCRSLRLATAGAPLPWQRDLPVMQRLESTLEILGIESEGALSSCIVSRTSPAGIQILDLLQAPQTPPEQLTALLTAILERHPGVGSRMLNLVVGDPAAGVLESLGFGVTHRQREMRVDLAH